MHADVSPTIDNIFNKMKMFKQLNKNLWKYGGLEYS